MIKSHHHKRALISSRESPIYLEDWIGLRALDEAGKLVFLDTDGNHLIFTDEWFIENIVLPYLN